MTLRQRLVKAFKVKAYRRAYLDDFIDSSVATQITVLREQRDWTQEKLAGIAKMKQSQISKLEDVNNASWTLKTLRRIARAFDLVLVVRFESFGALLPDIERFGRTALERVSFDQDPAFATAETDKPKAQRLTKVAKMTLVGAADRWRSEQVNVS